MNDRALIPARDEYLPATAQEIRSQVNLIQSMMKEVMREDVHFGTIPGCGNKPALLKPGAEKICLTFRLAVRLKVEHVDLPGGHREFTVRCSLIAPSGAEVGEGIGICSTMESKYRYRWDSTGEPVPNEYWDSRDSHLLGGDAYAPRKVGGKWKIFRKVEHDNPADYYNTCVKMAKKRAHVDATLTTTAASDIFEQDIDEMPPESVESRADAGRKTYPQADFDRNMPEWKRMVESGEKTPGQIIAMVGSKLPMTDEQQKALLDLVPWEGGAE